MNKEIKLLWELQKIELEENKLTQVFHTLNQKKELKNLYQIIEKEIKEFDLLKEDLDNKKEKLNHIEEEIKEIEKNLKENEMVLYSGKIKNYKEMEILSKKSKSLQEVKKDKEEILLKYMEDIEELERKLKKISNKIRKMQKEYKEIRLKNREDIDKIKKELEKLKGDRASIIERIKPEYLTIYQKLKATKADPIAKIVDSKCSGCNTILSLAKIQEVSQYTLPVYCENCGRLIFAE